MENVRATGNRSIRNDSRNLSLQTYLVQNVLFDESLLLPVVVPVQICFENLNVGKGRTRLLRFVGAGDSTANFVFARDTE